ncbi:MAG: MmcQ/YjbR family DNA-binding protein [Acidobacteria bacterium]|nr:MmcQ/YjbR family DNA-binding protein [Acidobacteriota bacterium]
MTFDDLYKYCMSRKGATNDLPFDETTICFRVMGKIFALTDIKDDPPRVNLKSDPELALELREMYTSVIPGYHMNKKHWNTVIIDGSISDSEIEKMIDHSYKLIIKSLKKSDREDLERS